MSNTTASASSGPHPTHQPQTPRARRRIQLIDVALIPCYIPLACLVCVVMGGQCLYSLLSDRPIGGVCGHGSASAQRDYADLQLRRKDERLLEKEAPRPLPAVRKRALTIPLPETEGRSWWRKGRQGTLDQAQSSLFGRLPLEVRELIYRFYLAPDGRRIHLFRRTDRRLGHCVCTDGPDSHSYFPKLDWGYDDPSRTRAWKRYSAEKPVHSNNLLPLLKSCRRLYSEATPLLYSSNIFCFQDIATLLYFVRTVLPHRRNQIKAIQLPWMKTYLGFPQPNGELSQVWEALKQMPNLQVIHIVRLTIRQGSPCDWRYPTWTYWIGHLKSKCDIQIVGAQDIPPLRYRRGANVASW
ncbi:MAG: hypothetical protein LQ349_008051 [Xanthoria aureola]|nr:MAG: hypothetical protein LQ349_008051 [Xanthoria aureola]